MPGLVDCGVVLRTALPSGNAFFTSFYVLAGYSLFIFLTDHDLL